MFSDLNNKQYIDLCFETNQTASLAVSGLEERCSLQHLLLSRNLEASEQSSEAALFRTNCSDLIWMQLQQVIKSRILTSYICKPHINAFRIVSIFDINTDQVKIIRFPVLVISTL